MKKILILLGLFFFLLSIPVHASQSMVAPTGYVPYTQNVSVTFSFTESDWDQAALNFNPNNQTCINSGGSYWSIQIFDAGSSSKTRLAQNFPLTQQSGTVVFDSFSVGGHWVTAYSNCYSSTGNLLATMGSFPIDFTIIDPSLPLITSNNNLPSAAVGSAYSQSVAVSYGSSPYVWSLGSSYWSIQIYDDGSSSKTRLAQHFPVNQQSGTVVFDSFSVGGHWVTAYSNCYDGSGNLSATMGSFPIDFTIIDPSGSPSPTPTPSPTNPSMTSNPSGDVPNQNVSVTFSFTEPDWNQAALDFNPNNQLCAQSGSLPPGLSLNSSTGEITGTPTTTGTYNFTVQVTDNNAHTTSKVFTIIVNSPPTITTTTLVNGTVGGTYSETVQTTSGTIPFTWSVVTGSLPSGLSLGSSTGTISGTPTTAGTFNFTVQVIDDNSNSDTQALSIVVNAAPSITTNSPLLAATNGAAYSQALGASGGTTPLSWSVSAGSLPSGISLSSAGVVSGTPTATGTFNFTAQVIDANSVSDTKAFSLTVNAVPAVTTTSLVGATLTGSYSKTLLASGGTAPLSWNVISGSLPAGLSLAGSTGIISGTPTATGTSNFTVQVSDAYSVTATKALSIVVNAAPVITTTTLPDGHLNTAYSQSLATTGGTTPFTWSVISGGLPAGLSLGSSTGVISGTPTIKQTASFTVQVVDTNGVTSTQALTLRIKQ